MNLESIKLHEGFRSKPYIDPLVLRNPEHYGISKTSMNTIKKYFDKLKITFGYGFTFITEEEADLVLQCRLETIKNKLESRINFFDELPEPVQEALIEMAYQMGVDGLLKFKKTLKYLSQGNWYKAYQEAKDSRWYKQTTNRAEEVLSKIKYVAIHDIKIKPYVPNELSTFEPEENEEEQ